VCPFGGPMHPPCCANMKYQPFDFVFIQVEWFIVRLSTVVIIFRVA
jgi:hypothetical protein